MKLDLPLKIWFAWQDGDTKKLSSFIDEAFKSQRVEGRIPSEMWQYTTIESRDILVKAIMLSSRWVMKNNTGEYVFTRGAGVPQKSIAQFSWSFPFIIVEK